MQVPPSGDVIREGVIREAAIPVHVPHDVIVSMSMTKEIIFELWLHIMSNIDSVGFYASFYLKLQQ